eukprot:1345623-Amphidinium_carterae.2
MGRRHGWVGRRSWKGMGKWRLVQLFRSRMENCKVVCQKAVGSMMVAVKVEWMVAEGCAKACRRQAARELQAHVSV